MAEAMSLSFWPPRKPAPVSSPASGATSRSGYLRGSGTPSPCATQSPRLARVPKDGCGAGSLRIRGEPGLRRESELRVTLDPKIRGRPAERSPIVSEPRSFPSLGSLAPSPAPCTVRQSRPRVCPAKRDSMSDGVVGPEGPTQGEGPKPFPLSDAHHPRARRQWG